MAENRERDEQRQRGDKYQRQKDPTHGCSKHVVPRDFSLELIRNGRLTLTEAGKLANVCPVLNRTSRLVELSVRPTITGHKQTPGKISI